MTFRAIYPFQILALFIHSKMLLHLRFLLCFQALQSKSLLVVLYFLQIFHICIISAEGNQTILPETGVQDGIGAKTGLRFRVRSVQK